MRIRQHMPLARLRPYVECIWSLEGNGAGALPRIPPFGEVELAFYPSAPFDFRQPGDTWRSAPEAHLTGPRTRYLELITGEVTDVLSVRFRPGAFEYFRPGATPAIAEDVVDAREIWGPEVARLIDRLRRTQAHEQRARLVEAFLLERLHPPTGDFSWRAGALLRDLLESDFEAARSTIVDRIARDLGLTRRTCQRRFQNTFGLSPRAYYNLLRFEAAVKDTLRLSALRSPDLSLTDQALKFGYYDQSHFIKDFQKYIGRAPGEFLGTDGRFISEII